ncbi:MAG: hypothetical protein A2Y12_19795 [Planctomycetes bacterium GWF2_42_9]|nr:MAG: hypothetical protein A2Y12_19795 [Planctomycetes bacterium GWF2_42_9]
MFKTRGGVFGWSLLFIVAWTCVFVVSTEAQLVFKCNPDNDLYQLVTNSGLVCQRYATAAEAIQQASVGAGVLILADDYPQSTTPIDASTYSLAASKNIRLYVEYPSMLPNLSLGAPQFFATAWYGSLLDRLVINSAFFGSGLVQGRILTSYDAYYQPVTVNNAHIVAARVAGFDTAVLGLPAVVKPILFEHPNGNIMVATTRLSCFVTGRLMPTEGWKTVWETILNWLGPGSPALNWTPTVHTRYSRNETLPANALLQCLTQGVQWYQDSQLLVSASGLDWVNGPRNGVEPLPAGWVAGDGTYGILECYIGKRIFVDGSQAPNPSVRADCSCESSMGLAFGGSIFNDTNKKNIAAKLNDYIFFVSDISQGPRANPVSPSYGMLSHNTKGLSAYFCDDNARAILGAITSSALLRSSRWDEAICKSILANFRTTGPKGYHEGGGSISEESLQNLGWEYYWNWNGTSYSPHYQSYIWATYLWLYDQTGYEPLLERSRTGIELMMKAYPNYWVIECGRRDEELAHMLLPLAWLVRVDNTAEHRAWLQMLVTDFINSLDIVTGAVPQKVDVPYSSNSQYGTGEAPIVYQTGDPGTDLLYTMNFAFSGLNEASYVLNDPCIPPALDKMQEFLVRIQTQSTAHPELSGTWYRGIDFSKWEYWGSDGDIGWGVWTAETGWTHSWITSTLALRYLNQSLWDLIADSNIAIRFDALRQQMLPDEMVNPPIPHVYPVYPVEAYEYTPEKAWGSAKPRVGDLIPVRVSSYTYTGGSVVGAGAAAELANPHILTDGIVTTQANIDAAASNPWGYYVHGGFNDGVIYGQNSATQPGVTFDLGAVYDLSRAEINYVVVGPHAVYPASQVKVSVDGGPVVSFTPFNNSSNTNTYGDARNATIDLSGLSGRSVHMEFTGGSEWSCYAEGTFYARGGGAFTDGIRGTNFYSTEPELNMGWGVPGFTIYFDLGQTRTLAQTNINYFVYHPHGVYEPASVAVSFSTQEDPARITHRNAAKRTEIPSQWSNGGTFTGFSSSEPAVNQLLNLTGQARWVKMVFTNQGEWLVPCEVTFYNDQMVINEPSEAQSDYGLHKFPGDTIGLIATASNTAALVFQWKRNGTILEDGTYPFGIVAGGATPYLKISDAVATVEFPDEYSCQVAKNGVSNESVIISLGVSNSCWYDMIGDMNDDCIVNLIDFQTIALHWLQSDPACGNEMIGNLNNDCTIDFYDLQEFALDWLRDSSRP